MHALMEDTPALKMEGETYPPPQLNQILSNVIFYFRMAGLLLLLAGPEALEQYLGIQNPPWIYRWAHENKVGGGREGGGTLVSRVWGMPHRKIETF